MIPVPGGKCKIGSPESESDRGDDEGPQLEVTVDPMWVAEKEVSWAEYKEFMNLYHIFKDFEGRGFRVVDVERCRCHHSTNAALRPQLHLRVW